MVTKRRYRVGLAAVVCAAVVALVGVRFAASATHHAKAASTSSVDGLQRNFTTNTPYAPGQDPGAYEPSPAGFAPVFTEMVARHGARALDDADDIALLQQVIADAKAEGKLKPLGGQLSAELQTLASAHEKLGFGALSGLGRREHADLAKRLLRRLPNLFDAAATGRHIRVLNSGIPRAADSGAAFADALKSAEPDLAPLVDPPVVDTKTLYFHKEKTNADYANWLKSDPTLKAKLDEITYSKESARDAMTCLDRLFAHDFVDRLASGTYRVGNAVDAAMALFNVYAIAPGLSAEGTWHFDRYLDRGAAEHFAYVDDATTFYRKGPSFAGNTITYAMAEPLEDDFFQAVEAYRNGTSTDVARLRFAHAETVIPLAALMRLPGSEVQVPTSDTFSYRHNPWRGADVAPYAANMQWDAYRNAAGRMLIRMLYNEKETHFKADCKPYAPGSYYYDLDELKRCYQR
ncbi:histidine phosphatase family protein [Planosporangium thailandense]|uniref:Multiple inositol polyphosphate phosphatase 1 n=1 Tax=Planosporangium thailandense TaxID=765197 RepID=A0ABX0XUD7_9ACTN|nr:histidine-type phosphatase [Planosporangium thailandense]NJC69614.1 histidine phosphatase family protein [Planosporangium thailandense]